MEFQISNTKRIRQNAAPFTQAPRLLQRYGYDQSIPYKLSL